MPILLSHLKDSSIGASVQIIIVSLIGDTFLLTKDDFGPYLEESLNILEDASKHCSQISEEVFKKPDELLSFVQYQGALIEAYTCFVQNIKSVREEHYQILGTHIYNIFGFLMDIIHPNFDPSEVR